MTLRGTKFTPVFQASGATNHGQGYWYHRLLAPLGCSFQFTTPVTKTTTLLGIPGNMPLKDDGLTPKEWIPKCIIVDRKRQLALNAVGLSGRGLEFNLQAGWWWKFTEPFLISVMSVAKTRTERLAELRAIFERLASASREVPFRASWGVQVNLSCPNGGLDPNTLLDEAIPILELAERTLPKGVSFTLKFGPEVHPSSVVKIAQHPRCDAVCVFNTLPFGKNPTWAKQTPPVEWEKLFGTSDPAKSPMALRFPGYPGGLSGAPLKPFLFEWIRCARALGISKPIIAGGGLLSAPDAQLAFDAGADATSPGSIAFLAPTQLRKMVRASYKAAHFFNRN